MSPTSNPVRAAESRITFEHPMKTKCSPLIFFEHVPKLSLVFDPLDTLLTWVKNFYASCIAEGEKGDD